MLHLETRAADGITILHCNGRLVDREEASKFSDAISSAISYAPSLIIDLTGLESIDTAGLGELAVIQMWARASGCSLKVAGANACVRQILESANVLRIFETYATVDDAARALKEARSQAARGAA
jgi:anti-sigma B factor antagonist